MKPYGEIQTYEELLETNIEFLEGKREKTFYYGSEWEWRGDENKNITSTLVTLAKCGVFTYHSQLSTKDQRSYLAFFMSSEMVEKIYAYLEANPCIWVQFEWKNGLVWSSIESKSISLKKSAKKVWVNEMEERITAWQYPRIESILSKMVYGMIICRDYHHHEEACSILLNCLQNTYNINKNEKGS